MVSPFSDKFLLCHVYEERTGGATNYAAGAKMESGLIICLRCDFSIHVGFFATTGWWFGTFFYDFPFSWECHHPN